MAAESFAVGFLEWSQALASAFGYFGIFMVSFLGSASVIFPVPAFLVIFIFGGILNPWLVGISAGIGSALGELTGYAVGFGGKKILDRKYKNLLEKTRSWMEKYRAFFVIILFAATPLPDDILGILCGAVNYDLKKFFLASLIGKIAMSLALAWGGFFSIQWVLTFFGG